MKSRKDTAQDYLIQGRRTYFLRCADSNAEGMPRFDHTCFPFVPFGCEEELLHVDNTPIALGNRGAQLLCSLMEAVGHRLGLFS